MVSIVILGLLAASVFAQLCSEGGFVRVGPYSGIPTAGNCVAETGIQVTVEFNVCYKSSFSCNMACDTSCCTSDFKSCMECTGCDAFYDSSFIIVNGTTYLFFDNENTNCSGVGGPVNDKSCFYDGVHICQGNIQSDFTNATHLSKICTPDPEPSTTTSTTTGSTSTSGSTSGSPSARSRSDSSGSSIDSWL